MNLEEKFSILVNKMNVGHYDEVIFETNYLIKKFPKQEALYNLLALTYQAKGEYDKSIDLLNDALKRSKNNTNFLNNIGLGYYKKKDYIKAEGYFNEVLKLNPRFINTINNLAGLYNEINNAVESEKLYLKALSINNNVLETNYNYASFLQTLGRYSEAEKYYNKTLEINKDFTRADKSLAMLKKYKKDDKYISSLEEKIKNKNLHKSNIKDLSFALGKIYEDIGEYKKSFEYIKTANDIKKQLSKFDIKSEIEFFEKIKEFHKNNKIENFSRNEDKKKIIFILGMPRTGTSLVEQIISSHSKVYGAGELPFLDQYFRKYLNNSVEQKHINEDLAKFKKNYLAIIEKMTKSEVVTDKAPLNFRWIGLIKIIFPNAIIIHCKRDPLENSWSIYKNDFEGGMLFSNDVQDIANYYNIYQNLMNFWKNTFKKEIYDINYEDLINNSESKIREIINFSGLDWQDSCLEYYNNKRSIKTVSFNQARRPIYKDSLKGAARYKNYIQDLKNALSSSKVR